MLEVYNSDFAVAQKEDKSPLTIADTRSHGIISRFLKEEFSFPVLSEEGRNIPFEERRNWEYYWLAEPLDGTKEFAWMFDLFGLPGFKQKKQEGQNKQSN
jgi:3'(2'), 5'-bisphosphate nucleotidase